MSVIILLKSLAGDQRLELAALAAVAGPEPCIEAPRRGGSIK
jgi:hypothetical protein